jgi:hypothetical protein
MHFNHARVTPAAGNIRIVEGSGAAQPGVLRKRRRPSLRVFGLYALALLREFRWTLAGIGAAIALGTFVLATTVVDGQRPALGMSLYGAWMAMLAQPLYNPPPAPALMWMFALYPLIGAVLIGEGVIRLALLMMSRRRGEKEWTRVMVSTYRDHVIICGLGHLGIRVVEQLLASGTTVVALERRRSARFIAQARDLGVPVMIRDMKEDQALLDAGIEYARSIVIATNDAIANLEVALDAKRMNPKIRVVMRMFDEKIAHKISDAMDVDVAFSSSTLAAPAVAKMALAME